MKKVLFFLIVLCSLAMMTYAADTVVEGFENDADPAGWQAVSPDGQTTNATNPGTVPVFGADHVTEGAKSGKFTVTWTLPGAPTGASNPYVSTDPLTFWSIRYNVATPTGLPNNSIPNTSKVRCDIYNNTADAIQFALCVRDNAGGGGLERGPFKTIAANTSTIYEWDMATEAATSFVTGDGVLDGSSSVLRGAFLYSTTAPTVADFSMDVDNIRIVEAQSDLQAPAIPTILAARQGSAPGKLKIDWVANTEPDLKEYKIYMMKNADFGKKIQNRFDVPKTATKVVAAPATTTEIDVVTSEPVYVYLTAADTALPSQNESQPSKILGAYLAEDGSVPGNIVVFDNKRYPPTDPNFATYGYLHMIVYDAQALQAAGKRFESCVAKAVSDSLVTLTPGNGVTIWGCAVDGVSTAVDSVSTPSISKITDYVNAGGKLMISGNGIGADMVTNGDATQQAFYANILRATLINSNAAQTQINLGGIFSTAGLLLHTGTNQFDVAAYATATNEVIDAAGGAYSACSYEGVTSGAAAVYWGNKVVYLGFGFESIRDTATSNNFANAKALRAAVMEAIMNYLNPPPQSAVTGSWSLYE